MSAVHACAAQTARARLDSITTGTPGIWELLGLTAAAPTAITVVDYDILDTPSRRLARACAALTPTRRVPLLQGLVFALGRAGNEPHQRPGIANESAVNATYLLAAAMVDEQIASLLERQRLVITAATDGEEGDAQNVVDALARCLRETPYRQLRAVR